MSGNGLRNHDLDWSVTRSPCYPCPNMLSTILLFAYPSSFSCPSSGQFCHLWTWNCAKLLSSLGLCLVLRIPLSQIWFLVFIHSQGMLDSFQKFLGPSYLLTPVTVHFQLSHSVSALTIGINPITILLLKLGKGNVFSILFSIWFWTPRVGGLWCVSVSPFPSSGPALRRWPVYGVGDHQIREALHQLYSSEYLMQRHLWCPHNYFLWNLIFSLRGGLVWQSSILTMEGIFRAIHNKCFCEKNLEYFRHWTECYDDLKIKPIEIVYPICHSLVGLTRHTYKTLESKLFWEKATAHRTWMLRGSGPGTEF